MNFDIFTSIPMASVDEATVTGPVLLEYLSILRINNISYIYLYIFIYIYININIYMHFYSRVSLTS